MEEFLRITGNNDNKNSTLMKSTAQERINENILKLKYFLSTTDNEKPILPNTIPIDQLLRQYLNDNDFYLSYEEVSLLSEPFFQEVVTEAYQSWRKSKKKDQRLDIDEFIQHWISGDEKMHVWSQSYDQLIAEEVQTWAGKMYAGMTIGIARQLQDRGTHVGVLKRENPYQKQSTLSPSASLISQKPSEAKLDYYLNKFYQHYNKKIVKQINLASFDHISTYFNTICLTKWMLYVKEIGLLHFNKQMSVKKMKEVFTKHEMEKSKSIGFKEFKNAVMQTLLLAYKGDQEKLIKQGYKLIGISNRKNCLQKFASIGVIVPKNDIKFVDQNGCSSRATFKSIKSTVMAKVNTRNHLYSKTQAKEEYDDQYQKQEINAHLQKSTISPKITLQDINKMKSPDQSLKNIQKIRKAPNKKVDLSFLDLQEEDDPYLKRYNHKENIQKYKSIINRIDQRVEKVMDKMR